MIQRLAGVVLAAGAGTRLRPLTLLRPKALCPVGGVALLDLALRGVVRHTGAGAGQTAVNAHHLVEQIVGHVDAAAHVQVEQPVALGTAGALGALAGWIDGRDVLLANADAYLPGGLDSLVNGWDGERARLLVVPVAGAGDFDGPGDVQGHRYVGACVLPWRLVRHLSAEPSGLYEVMWRGEHAAGRLDLAVTTAVAMDCGTPADYLQANLHASGGDNVIGRGAVVRGRLTRCVVWDGAWVGADEDLHDCVRAGSRAAPLTVCC